MGLSMMRHKGNKGTLDVPYMGGLDKCKDIARAVEVDVVEGLKFFMVERYWFC